VLRSWAKAWKEKRARCYWSSISVAESKRAVLKKHRLIEENFNYMEQAKRGAKNVKILIFWLFLFFLHCSLDCIKIHLLHKFLIL
jgi:hypothetical protein